MSRYLFAAVLVVGGAAAGTAWLGGLQHLDVEVVGMADTTRSDRITELVVEVTNPGPEVLWPTFSVPGNALKNWYAWTIEDGPQPLPAGETGTYRITQEPYTGVPLNEGFRVVVNDVHQGRIRGASEVVQPTVDWPLPAVLNPGFESWEPSMFHATPLPYAWVHWVELHGDDRYSISGSDGKATLVLEPDAKRTTGEEWSLVSMRQRIDFPTHLHIELVDATRGAFAAGARTEAGVWLEDVHGGTQVVVLFTGPPTNADQPAFVDVDFGAVQSHRILVTNRSVDLDLEQIYADRGWHIPERQNLPRLLPHGPADVGMGDVSVMAAMERAEIARPMELKVFVASYPPHEMGRVEATFSFVGGPAGEPSPSRVT